MSRLLVILTLAVLVLGGCAGVGAPGSDVATNFGQAVKYVHDDAHAVGCWFIVGTNGGGGSIACLPDKDYQR